MTTDPSFLHALAIVSLAAGALLAAGLAVVAWRRRDVPGAPAFVALMLAAVVWAGVYAVELAADGLAAKIMFLKIEYLGIAFVPVAWLAFALDYTGRRYWLAPWRLALLCALPVTTLLLAITNDAHGFLWRSIVLDESGPFPVLQLGRGGWYWINIAYSYVALMTGTILLTLALIRESRLHRRPAMALMIGVAIPWLANVVYIIDRAPLPNLDLTPIAFALGGLFVAWGLFRFRLLDVVLGLAPAARNAVIDGMGDAVLVLDLRGHLIDLNPATERLLGLPAATLLDRPAATVLAGWPVTVVDARAIDEARTPFEVSIGGVPRHYDVLASPLRRRDGRPAGRLIVARDVTEREQAERGLELLAETGRVLTSSLDVETTLGQVARLIVSPALADYCIVDVRDDEHGAIRDVAAVHVDPAREALLRAARRRHPPVADAPDGVMAALRTGQSELLTTITPDAPADGGSDSEHRQLLLELGATSSIVVPLMARDQTLGAISLGSLRPERRFGPSDVALAEEVARRAAVAVDNARLYAAARAATSVREDFLSIAAHELRTPLTTVKGYVQLSRRLLQRTPLDRERLAESQAGLERQVARQEGLIDDLLDIARIQRGQLALRLETIDLVELARTVLGRFEQAVERTQAHTLTLDAAVPVVGRWDADRLDQVVTNLVSNALKYSPDGGLVVVRVGWQGDQAELVVQDQGLGMTPAEQDALFRPFARGHNGAGIKGVGLGLYIVAQIVAQHAGTVTVDSAPGAGTTFTVRLPACGPLPADGTP